MQFLQPHLLWGLLGLVIPLLIHLFNFQKTEKVVFSNNRLLMEISMQTKKARQVKNLLLLLLRMLALALVVMAFAQPVIPSFSGTDPGKGMAQSIVFLDNSPSMFVGKDGAAPIDLAQEAAKKWPEKVGPKGWFQLVSNGFGFHPWTSARGFAAQVAEVIQPESGRSLNSILNRLHRQMNSRMLGDKKSVLIISDFQKSGMGDIRRADWDSSIAYKLLAVEQPVTKNFRTDSVWLAKPIDNQSKSQVVKVKLVSSGQNEESKVNLQLFANGSLISGKIVSPGNQNPFITELPFRIKPGETLACTLKTDDPDITFDNEFFFRIQSPRPVRVCLISSGTNVFLNQVFSDKNLFRFSLTSFRNTDYQKIKEAELVILNQPAGMAEALSAALLENLSQGKSVLFVAGKESGKAPDPVLQLETQSEIPQQKAEDWKIVLPGADNPFFANAFREISQSSVRPFARPAAWLSKGTALLKYENGAPYLSRMSREKGQIFWLAAPLENEESNVQKHPLVIPMLFRIALSGQDAASGSLFNRVQDDFFYLQSDSLGSVKEQVVSLQNGNQVYKTSLVRTGSRYRIELPSGSLQPGFYQVKAESQLLGLLAMNAGREESVFEFYSEEELKSAFSAFPNISVNQIKSDSSPAHAGQSADDSVPLWKYFIAGALLFLIMEMWLSRKNLLQKSAAQ